MGGGAGEEFGREKKKVKKEKVKEMDVNNVI